MRKELIIRVIWILITVTITVGLIQWAGHLLDPYEAEDGLDAVKAFHELDDNSVDVIVLGSSRAWKGCDTRVMQDEYGIKAYNYACNWQALNTTLLFLQDSIRIQSPKVVFVETGHVNKVLKKHQLKW